MNNLLQNIGHIATSIIIIIAVTVLAWHGTITGSEALTIIGVLGGVSVGGSVASSSVGAPGPSSVTASTSLGTSTSVPIEMTPSASTVLPTQITTSSAPSGNLP